MTNVESTTNDDSIRFPSLESLRVAHSELLKQFRSIGNTPEMIIEVETFIQRGKATGALLDNDNDRWTAQSELDYWNTQLYRPGYEPPDATLDEFDPQLAPALDDSLCPYVGLDSFHEANQSVYYGRRHSVKELIKRLTTTRFLIVMGSSGSGKSSIVRAGLIPELKKGAIEGSDNWKYLAPMVPGSNPLLNLAHLLSPGDGDTAQAEFDVETFREDSEYLTQIVSEGTDQSIVLIVDQFEEIFTLCTDETARNQFVNNLIMLSRAPGAVHRVILTMRSDFELHIGRLPSLQNIFEQAAVHVTPLTAGELREAIEAPAARIGLKFEEGVVDALLNDTLGEPAALPLLQFTLLKLWEKRERNRITWEAYKKLGGGRLTLARSADEFYNRLIPEEQITMRRILLKMVRPGEGLEVTSNRISINDLYQKSEANDRIDRVLERLINARLVRVSEGDIAADKQVEIAHEALIRNWPRLVEWLEEERVTLRQRQRLTIAAEEWQRLNRATAALWRRELLEEALRYDDMNELERQFVKASKARQERSRRFWAAGIVIIITILSSVTIYSMHIASKLQETNTQLADKNQKVEAASTQISQQVDRARSSELSTIGLVLADAQLDLAMLLGVQADTIDSNEKSQSALSTLLQKSAPYHGTLPTQDDIVEIQFTPNGKIFASREKNGITLWNTDTLQPLTKTPLNGHYAGITTLAVSDSKKVIASGGEDGTIVLWDAIEHKMLGEPFPQDSNYGSIISLAFSPTGNILASSGSNTNAVTLWDISDLQNPKQIGKPLSEHNGSVLTIAFNPNEETLATGSYDGSIILWDIIKPDEPKVLSTITVHTDWVNKLVFLHGDGNTLISASDDSRVILWNVKDPKNPKPIEDNNTYSYVRGLAISPNNQTLATGNYNGSIIIWNISNIKNPERIATLNQNNEGANFNLLTFVDNDILASSTYEGNIILWRKNADGWDRVSNSVSGGTGYANGIVLLPDENTVATGNSDSTISFWDVSDTKKPIKKEESSQGHLARPTGMQFSPDGSLLTTYGDNNTLIFEVKSQDLIGSGNVAGTNHDGSLLAYVLQDKTTGEQSIRLRDTNTLLDTVDPFPGQNPLFSPDGKWLIYETLGKDNTPILHIRDVSNNDGTSTPGVGNFPKFSPNGKILIYQTVDQNTNRINLWNLAEEKPIAQIEGSSPYFSSDNNTLLYQLPDLMDLQIGFYDIASTTLQVDKTILGTILTASQNNKVLMYTAYNTDTGKTDLKALDITNGYPDNQLSIENGNLIKISVDGNILIYSDIENKINVYDLQNNRSIDKNIDESSIIWTLDGRYLLYQAADGKLNLCDTTSQNLISLDGSYLASTPDGSKLIYRTFENNSNIIRLWDTANNKIYGLPIKESYGSFFAFSPNGETLVTKNEKNSVVFWDLTKTWLLGEPINDKAEEISDVFISQDGKTLARIQDMGIVIQDVESGKFLSAPFSDHSTGFSGAFPSFSPDGKFLAVGNSNANATTLWNLYDQVQIAEFDGFFPAFSPDGEFLAIGNYNSTKLWDLSANELTGTEFPGTFPAFSPDGGKLAIGDYSTTKLWDLSSKELIDSEFPGYIPAFSPDGEFLAIGNGSTTTLWNIKTQEPTIIGAEFPGYIPAFSRDGARLAIGAYDMNITKIWDTSSLEQFGDEFSGNIPSFGPDGMTFAVGSEAKGTTTLWKITSLAEKINPFGLSSAGTSVVFSLNGKMLASFDASDGIVIRNLTNDETNHLQTEKYEGEISGMMAFYENDTRFAALGTDGTLVTWDVETGEGTMPEESDQLFTKFTGFARFSPNGNYLVYDENNSLIVWDMVHNKQYDDLEYIEVQDPVNIRNIRIAFSPDGALMALAEGDNVQLYNFPNLTENGEEIQTDATINGLGLVMEDNLTVKYLFVLEQSGNTQIWDWDTDTKKRVGNPIQGVQFISSSTNNHTVIYVDSTGRLIKYKWDIDNKAIKKLLCDRIGRNFKRDEWVLYNNPYDYPSNQQLATCPQWPLEPETKLTIPK